MLVVRIVVFVRLWLLLFHCFDLASSVIVSSSCSYPMASNASVGGIACKRRSVIDIPDTCRHYHGTSDTGTRDDTGVG